MMIPRVPAALATMSFAAAFLAGCNSTRPVDNLVTNAAAINGEPSDQDIDRPILNGGGESSAPEPLGQRIAAIDSAVARWKAASNLAAAKAAAEAARNLVEGPHGPDYGDSDGDGAVAGASAIGLLPGVAGEPGLASADPNPCVVRDVLGGSWADPAARWATLATAISRWSPSRNTFPALPSHPQRIVGWASLALATGDLATARGYADHAQLHADVSRRAAGACAS